MQISGIISAEDTRGAVNVYRGDHSLICITSTINKRSTLHTSIVINFDLVIDLSIFCNNIFFISIYLQRPVSSLHSWFSEVAVLDLPPTIRHGSMSKTSSIVYRVSRQLLAKFREIILWVEKKRTSRIIFPQNLCVDQTSSFMHFIQTHFHL